jgi:hypothetical protein
MAEDETTKDVAAKCMETRVKRKAMERGWDADAMDDEEIAAKSSATYREMSEKRHALFLDHTVCAHLQHACSLHCIEAGTGRRGGQDAEDVS